MNEFSPQLAEKFVWKLNKDWLMRVPCFSLVVERLLQRPESGMEREGADVRVRFFKTTMQPPMNSQID